MEASTSEISNVQILDLFYEELAETAGEAGLSLPWYKTSFVHTPELKRFRSVLTLPGLRLFSSDAKHYFIPEAKFSAIAQNRHDAENAAAGEACEFLKRFTQRPHLIASEWSIDTANPLHQELAESQVMEPQQDVPVQASQATEGHHSMVLTVSSLGRGGRGQVVVPSEVQDNPAESSGRLPETFANEVELLRRQIEVLSSLVDRDPLPDSTSSSVNVIPTASTSRRPTPSTAAEFRSEIEPA